MDRKIYFDIEQFDNQTLEEIATVFSNLSDQYQGIDHVFRIESYGYDGGIECFIETFREENDKEYNARMQKYQAKLVRDEKAKQSQEEKERKLYQRLAKKYGDTTSTT